MQDCKGDTETKSRLTDTGWGGGREGGMNGESSTET